MTEKRIGKSLLDFNYGKNLPPLDIKKGNVRSRKNLLQDFVQRSPRMTSSPYNLNSSACASDTMISLNETLFGGDVLKGLQEIDFPNLKWNSKEEREKILRNNLDEIDKFDGSVESQKKFMRALMNDLEYVMNQNENLCQTVSKLVEDRKKVNEVVKTVNSIVKSVDNFNKKTSRTDVEISEMNKRISSIETVVESCYNSSRLGLIILDENESEEIESGEVKPHIKVHEMLRYMNVNYSKSSIVNTFLTTSKRMIRNESKIVKVLEIKFNDNITAGRIFAHITKWNSEASKSESNSVRYFAERPLGPKMLNLFKKSKLLVEERKIIKAIPTERGIKIKFLDQNREGEQYENTMFVTCDSDLDRFTSLIEFPTPYKIKEKNTTTPININSNKRKQTNMRTSGTKKTK
ncbi:hypothetical protein PVAND_014236 [Polypedilum vanderplanki]|uniref:Uncharacterized protein n=1 Tax=Polypedilum vanderplanki TaxID=319348 RepID=A0A9J6CS50_POLVA|nr:hypothetical protein PVAND_014236 [Polypedilum vanderplanki]